ncbi:putative calcium-activated chloride channel regulator 4A-like [Apostichopus japonicus]|uniref:Putative calcium-activated chloride channel regulator 4A-like n=1 Tax=Stichopus japonicus TaxID=307972 RepID=A0A2G8JXV2_STIJA|nr:putative calcium-activated chloride channel regulator 4A-like [Apostichopus japonicus]
MYQKIFKLSDLLASCYHNRFTSCHEGFGKHTNPYFSLDRTRDDFMEGQATGYELMFTSTRSAMRDDFGQVEKVTEDTLIYATLEKPKPAQNTELLNVSFASYFDSRIYLAIRAFDEYNNFGGISNILEVSLISGNTSVPVTPYRLQTTGQTDINQGNLSKVVFSLIVLIGTLSATGIFVLVSVLVAKKVKSRQKVSGSIPLVLK